MLELQSKDSEEIVPEDAEKLKRLTQERLEVCIHF